MAAAAGKKESVSLSLEMEVKDLEVVKELSTLATQSWAEEVWIGKMACRTKKRRGGFRFFEVQKWRQVRGPAGVVVCESRDLGIKWLQWYTLWFDGQGWVDMQFVCPRNMNKMLLKQVRTIYWKKWASRHECEELSKKSTA